MDKVGLQSVIDEAWEARDTITAKTGGERREAGVRSSVFTATVPAAQRAS